MVLGAGLLAYPVAARALAVMFWGSDASEPEARVRWQRAAQSHARLADDAGAFLARHGAHFFAADGDDALAASARDGVEGTEQGGVAIGGGLDAFGFRAAWINRAKLPDEYAEQAPMAVLSDLGSLIELAG